MTTFQFPKGEIQDGRTVEAPVTVEAKRAVSRKLPFKSPLWATYQGGHPYLLFLKSLPSVESGQKPIVIPYDAQAAEEGQTSWEPYFQIDDIAKPEYKWFAQSLSRTEPSAIPEKYREMFKIETIVIESTIAEEVRDSIFDSIDAPALIEDVAEVAPSRGRGRPPKEI
jgi:hypothetical protein